MRDFNEILKKAAQAGASDIHLSVGASAVFRIEGKLKKQEDRIFEAADMEGLLALFLTAEMAVKLKNNGELNIIYPVQGTGRFRINLYKKNGALSAAIRVLKETPPSLDELRAPAAVKELLLEESGIVIVNGRAGSGRTTTSASLMNEINHTQARHLVSIEENIEYPFANVNAVIDQRKLHEDTESYRAGIRAAIREDADIIVLSELDARETMDEVFLAAESGKLIIASMGTPDTISAIKRILDFYEADRQKLIKERLAGLLSCILSQTLVPLADGGRGAAFELLILNQAVRNLLKDGKYSQIAAIMQSDHRLGMTTLDDSLYEMFVMKLIAREEALAAARDRAYLEQRINVI